MRSYHFKFKHVLVTGATGGLGSAMVRRLADMGARLAVTARSGTALKELCGYLPDGNNTFPLAADLSNPGSAHELAERAIRALGHIDVLINSAGVGYFSLIEEADETNIRHLFEVNTFSPLLLIKALVPQMKRRGGGRIINIVSSAGRVPIPSVGIYGGSKSALAVMANTLRLELKGTGIDLLNIYPGTVDTAFEENALREKYRSGLCPVDHCGKPRFQIADRILAASVGPADEIWLEPGGRRMAMAALKKPRSMNKRLQSLLEKVLCGPGPKARPWHLLQVESSLSCNLKCIMCPWQKFASALGDKAVMQPQIWQAIRPHLPRIQSIDFTGGGEPLLQPHLVQWVHDAHLAGCETGILTNALLLDEAKADALMAAGIDWICVSMDGATAGMYNTIRTGSDFDRVCRNVAMLSRLRRNKHPKLMINFVLMTINIDQVEAMVSLGARLGVDQLNFKQCDVIRGRHGRGLGLFAPTADKAIRQLEKRLAKARRRAAKLGIETTAFSFTPNERPVCAQDPRNAMFVRYNGAVAPCINLAMGGPTTFLGQAVTMPQVQYGRLPGNDLAEIWDDKPCRFYRQLFNARADAHEKVYVDGMLRAASNLERLACSAIEAMPQAPKGCSLCHYLYDI
jgi:short-subunit dehydrogenase/MoaA/NifB/PqqE/SkfB family radical SAM enzyme